MFVFKAAVVGAGTMGGEIAQAIAAAGIPVVLKDVDRRRVDAGLERAREVTARRLGKRTGMTREEVDAATDELVGRIAGATTYDGFGDVDLVVEAVPERIEVKQAVFAELDVVTPGRAILASNTSALSVSEIADATSRPDRVCGLHFFHPASVMALLEVVEGDRTSPETVTAAINFAQAIRKQPIVSADAPGFVVNRILVAALSEAVRAQEDGGLSIASVDAGLEERHVAPIGPFALMDRLGLDTVLGVGEHLLAAYGPERFHVHEGLRRLVGEGRLGAKTGGGFYADGAPRLPGVAEADADELAELFTLKLLVEACLVLEEGVAQSRAIDLGLMAGAGLDPRRGILPPLLRADVEGLDVMLADLEQAAERHGERFAPPGILRRLVAQGRLGQKSGQGFFPWPRPDKGFADGPVTLETRGDLAIAWLRDPPANAISPATIEALRRVWDHVAGSGVRSLVIASGNPLLFSAGADLKELTTLDGVGASAFLESANALLGDMADGDVMTIAAVNGIAYGGGCELAMACDVRIAASSALFAQPEIGLGLIPGFGGTQRLARLVGASKALEMNLTGDAITGEEAFEFGLAAQVVDDHELLDAALAWARRLAGQAPLAVARIKRVSAAADLDEGLAAEQAAFAEVFASDDAEEGIDAFLGRRRPRWRGR